MFRLYAGLVRDGVWYNYTECHPIKGGSISILNSPDKSGISRLIQVIRGSISVLYTEDGENGPYYELKDEDYKSFVLQDAWLISRNQNKLFSGDEYPVFEEHFYCPRCSSPGNERYTKLEQSWDDLIERGLLDEEYLEDPSQLYFKTILPIPIVIEGKKNVSEGEYDTLNRTFLTLGQAQAISKNSVATKSEANMVYANWDATIVGINGMTEREYNILKRNNQESFTAKYIVDQENIDAMNEIPDLGLSGKGRLVSCAHCSNEIGGSLDFSNFFSFLSKKKSSHTKTENLGQSSIHPSAFKTTRSQTGNTKDPNTAQHSSNSQQKDFHTSNELFETSGDGHHPR